MQALIHFLYPHHTYVTVVINTVRLVLTTLSHVNFAYLFLGCHQPDVSLGQFVFHLLVSPAMRKKKQGHQDINYRYERGIQDNLVQ